jgi:hypothetical protein
MTSMLSSLDKVAELEKFLGPVNGVQSTVEGSSYGLYSEPALVTQLVNWYKRSSDGRSESG